MTDLRMINGKVVEFGMRCPGCTNADLKPILDPDFIAMNGDGWICGWCMIHERGTGIWTDFAVKQYNKFWIGKLREMGYPDEADAIENERKSIQRL